MLWQAMRWVTSIQALRTELATWTYGTTIYAINSREELHMYAQCLLQIVHTQ